MLISYLRAAILFLVLIVCVRLMGKRQLGEMEPSEFVISMLLANLAAIPMQDAGLPLLAGLVPILVVFALELLVAHFCLKSIHFRHLFCGKPVILIENGHILQQNLRRTRVTLDELTEHLREQGILAVDSVRYAILETDGQLSTFLFAAKRPPTARELGCKAAESWLPYTIISDGTVLHANLAAAGLDETWLRALLAQHGCAARDVFLLTSDAHGTDLLIRKEPTP